MPSLRDTKCPSCGVESGPCNARGQYHQERVMAANPTRYEYPDCEECRKLKDAMVSARNSLAACRPDYGETRPKSRWPKESREEQYRQEQGAKLTRARYELHLVTAHNHEAY